MGLSWQQGQTFCPYKGFCSYYSIDDARLAAWSYPDAYPEVRRISNLVSFEPDIVSVHLSQPRRRREHPAAGLQPLRAARKDIRFPSKRSGTWLDYCR